jgi:hypothetical protein
MADTEADTCRKYVLPKLYSGGWTDDQISEQRTITNGRLILVEGATTPLRKKGKRADYLLYYRRGYSIAAVEAKTSSLNAASLPPSPHRQYILSGGLSTATTTAFLEAGCQQNRTGLQCFNCTGWDRDWSN